MPLRAAATAVAALSTMASRDATAAGCGGVRAAITASGNDSVADGRGSVPSFNSAGFTASAAARAVKACAAGSDGSSGSTSAAVACTSISSSSAASTIRNSTAGSKVGTGGAAAAELMPGCFTGEVAAAAPPVPLPLPLLLLPPVPGAADEDTPACEGGLSDAVLLPLGSCAAGTSTLAEPVALCGKVETPSAADAAPAPAPAPPAVEEPTPSAAVRLKLPPAVDILPEAGLHIQEAGGRVHC